MVFPPSSCIQLRVGDPLQLRASQVYPRPYGEAICSMHRQWMVPRQQKLNRVVNLCNFPVGFTKENYQTKSNQAINL